MDINFSQTGQNIAVQENTRQVSSSKELEQDNLERQKQDVSASQSSQEILERADNRSVQEVGLGEIESAVDEISDFVQARNRDLNFSIDEKSDRSVVKVTDSESGEIIRQIPSEEVLALSERLKELQNDVGTAVGVLFSRQA